MRELPEKTAYWVCAYANNQHELGTDLGTDPMESSFLKAMQLSAGVLLVLDLEATAFSRIWCCFEEGVVTMAARGFLQGGGTHSSDRASLKALVERDGKEGREAPLVLDIAAVDEEGGAQLLTEGLTAAEQREDGEYFGCGWERKSER